MGEFFEKLGRLNFWSLNPIFCILAFVVMPGYFELLVMEYFTGFLLVLAIAFIIAYLATKIKEKFLYLYFGIVAFFLYMLSMVSIKISKDIDPYFTPIPAWIFLTIMLIASLVLLIRGYRENHTSYTNADLERICEGIKFDDEEAENTQKEDK